MLGVSAIRETCELGALLRRVVAGLHLLKTIAASRRSLASDTGIILR